MTTPDAEALAAIQSHHQQLQDELRARIATLDLAVAAGQAHQQASPAKASQLASQSQLASPHQLARAS